jgi:hypothetical protein
MLDNERQIDTERTSIARGRGVGWTRVRWMKTPGDKKQKADQDERPTLKRRDP